VLRVSALHRPGRNDSHERRRAWVAGRRNWRDHYVRMAVERARGLGSSRLGRLAAAARLSPMGTVRRALTSAANLLPYRRDRIRLGDLGSPWPVSSDFGWDRGTPVDRYYIESFLARHAQVIGGHVLEVGDASYSQRFGGSRVARQDVLHVSADNPSATIVGDLAQPGVLPPDTFDCIILTQTLQLIFDIPAALNHLHLALRPGGTLLLTVPFITQIDRGEWGSNWYWGFSPAAVERLLGDVFGREGIMIESYGNVFAATAFLQGLAVEEIDSRKLDVRDEAYPMLVAARAMRSS
jgi:SAM-dependent methyltransferase